MSVSVIHVETLSISAIFQYIFEHLITFYLELF